MYTDETGTVQKLKGRHKRFIENSARTARESEFPNYRHGAILVRGGSILNTAFNKSNHINWANKFRAKNCGHATHHGNDQALSLRSRLSKHCRLHRKDQLHNHKPYWRILS